MPLELSGLCTLLSVYDMPRSVRFYCDVLGFEVSSRSPTYATENSVELFHWTLLRRDGIELMLNTMYDEGERPVKVDRLRGSAHQDTGLYFGCRDLDKAYAHLQEHGVECRAPKVTAYGMRQLPLHDPDGYSITLQWAAAPEDKRATTLKS